MLGSTVRMATREDKRGFARAWELTLVPEKAPPTSRSFGLQDAALGEQEKQQATVVLEVYGHALL